MSIIVLIGFIWMVVTGNWFVGIMFLAIVGVANTKYTDSNRRGKWWK